MMEDNCPRVSSSESTDSSAAKQRKKRKWDQPDESLVSTGVLLPGTIPLINMGTLAQMTLPGINPVSGASLANPVPIPAGTTVPQVLQAPLQQHAAALVQKLVQPKIQDELIAREIIINDADSAIRCKLTKRQTQEEIQKSTGAVVITRGKYQPPNAPPDGGRPLYLHISAGAHLETTVERIKAVDQAAAMVEEMLKQGPVSNGVKVNHLLSTSVFLGFEADPSLNIAARIRGPNDQYINHIMHETGVTVLLRGHGSGNIEIGEGEEGQQPLHLLLSSSDPKSLERAKLLAENLLDTISAEFGAMRVSSSKVYGAVPPPPQLQAGTPGSGNELKVNGMLPISTTSAAGVVPMGPLSQSMQSSSSVRPQANNGSYPYSSLASGTSYNGYEGIYPQATPLQQVALALRQSVSPVTAVVAPATTTGRTEPDTATTTSQQDKRKRKFKELPAAANGPGHAIQNKLQGSEFPMPSQLTSHVGAKDTSKVPAPEVVKPSVNVMDPPPPRSMPPPPSWAMPPPPPPPKFNSPSKPVKDDHVVDKLKSESVIPDTLVKLMEYGDDDDEDEDTVEASKNHLIPKAAPKPFWAA